ncbi:RHS repeat protein, partial [Streptomyces sp. ADI96-02]|uniref:RHS repeat domain-containing protein n=1 Tax=Streptomyces sp. ADI96-02 TaxID=1522760 RepID=UPI0013DE322A
MDRFALGRGMSLGLPFVDLERGRVVLPSGEHVMDASAPSGLKGYKLDDVQFRAAAGPLPVAHAYVLESSKDGSRTFFDVAGDVVAVQDRFGHVSKLAWKVINGRHLLESVTGGWGSKLSVKNKGSKVTFTSPRRWGQAKAPQTVVVLSQGRVASVTGPGEDTTRVEWEPKGADRVFVPSVITSPTGARTLLQYQESEPRSGGVLAVSGFEVKGGDNRQLVDPVKVSLDPDGANGVRNYTGCPQCCADGGDRLENSGDGSFSYRVRFAQTNGQEVERSYNALHLRKSETVRVRLGSQVKEVSRTEFSYPGEKADGAPPRVKDAPGDYQMPSRVRVTTTDPLNPSRSKVSEAVSAFDGMGRQKSLVQGGVETTTRYGPHSIPVHTETRDTVDGARRVVEDTLTGDGKAIARTVTKAAKDATGELRTVSVEEFAYQGGELAGEIAKSTVTGDPAAAGGNPGPAVTSTRSSVDRDAENVGRRTDAVTGADEVTTTTVSDLASGATLSRKAGDRAASTVEYDIGDRPVRSSTAEGTVTTTSYGTWQGGGAERGGTSVTSRRASDGFATRSVTDELGREQTTQSNYQPSADGGRGAMLPDGRWRQTSAAEYDRYGRQTKAVDAGGRETTTDHDAWGRAARTTTPDGTVALSGYDDVAGATTRRTVPAGADKPAVTRTTISDDEGNPVKDETAYGDGTPGTTVETAYDAFGNPTRSQDGTSPYTLAYAYTPAGLPETETLTPRQGGTGPDSGSGADTGSPAEVKAEYILDAFGNRTHKKLSKGGQSTEGWKTGFDAAGRPEDVSLPGGGGTRTTVYSRLDGLVESVTLPDGSVAHRRGDQAGRTTESWTSPKDAPGDRREHVRTSYDPVTGERNAVWFAENEAGTKIAFSHYPNGMLKERTDPGGKKTAYTYTDDDKVASVTDHTGAVTAYAYDRRTGRMTTAVQTRHGRELARVSYIHDAAGRLARIDRGNGAASAYTFNDAGLPTGEKHTAPGGRVIAEHAYTYTPERQLVGETATYNDGGERRTATAYSYDTEG